MKAPDLEVFVAPCNTGSEPVDHSNAYAALVTEYEELQDTIESYVWENSNSLIELRRATRRLERETAHRQRLEEELRLSSKLEAMGQLAAGVAHEINTPVQYVKDNTAFVEEAFGELCQVLDQILAVAEAAKGQPTAEPAALLAERILAMRDEADLEFVLEEVPRAIEQSGDGLRRVTKIVKSMKDFAHPSNDATTPLDINRALESVATVTTNEWKYVADLEVVPSDELTAIHCPAGEINQVLVNLIVNAAHAIAERQTAEPDHRGVITVGIRKSGDQAEIWVADNGCGIPEENRDKVFDHFFTTKEVGKGSGQGLSLAHGVVVNRHGGTIQLESKVGEGTTFTLSLPIDGPVQPTAPAGAVAAAERSPEEPTASAVAPEPEGGQ